MNEKHARIPHSTIHEYQNTLHFSFIFCMLRILTFSFRIHTNKYAGKRKWKIYKLDVIPVSEFNLIMITKD